MRKRVFEKLYKDYGHSTRNRISDKLERHLSKTYRHEMKINALLRKDIRRVVTKALMGQTIELSDADRRERK